MRKLSLILALMFVLSSIVAGCDAKNMTSSASGSETVKMHAVSDASPVTPSREVTIRFLSWESVYKANHAEVAEAYEKIIPASRWSLSMLQKTTIRII